MQNCWLITDFGFAMLVDDGQSFVLSHRKRGTNKYRAPELIEQCFASKMCDIWAIGCILYRIATMDDDGAFQDDCQWEANGCGRCQFGRATPRLTPTHNKQLVQTVSSGTELKVPFWQQLNLVLEECFNLEPRKRPTARN